MMLEHETISHMPMRSKALVPCRSCAGEASWRLRGKLLGNNPLLPHLEPAHYQPAPGAFLSPPRWLSHRATPTPPFSFDRRVARCALALRSGKKINQRPAR